MAGNILSFNISETRHATKNLTTDITITSKVFIDKPKRNILSYPFDRINAGALSSGSSAVY